MPFLLTSFLLVACNFYVAIRMGKPSSLPQFARWLSHLLIAQFFAGALVLDLLTRGRTLSLNLVVGGVLALGLGSSVLFGLRLKAYSAVGRSLLDWKAGITFCSVAAGLYLSFTAINHWSFFRDEHSGIVLPQALDVDDVACGKLVLVSFDGDTAQWRCPTAIAWGDPIRGRVFVPWPSYTDGESVKLKSALESKFKQSSQVPTPL